MPANVSPCIPVRVKMRLQAAMLWAILSIPSILVTIILFISTNKSEFNKELPNKESNDSFSISSTPTTSDVTTTILEESNKNNKTYECYENATIYNSYIENSTFWIEGILLIGVGLLGLCGNFLTLAVLGKSKRSTFNQLLIVLSICDSLLIIFFIMMSACTTVMKSQPHWFVYIFPYLLWPLGNISITSTVLMVAAVSTERHLAICRPLQYKPSPIFYILLVFFTSLGVNVGRFLEFRGDECGDQNVTKPCFVPTQLMADERYIMFSRYWTEIIVIGIFPLLTLISLNFGIYLKIRKSARFRKLNTGFVLRFSKKRKKSNAAENKKVATTVAADKRSTNNLEKTENNSRLNIRNNISARRASNAEWSIEQVPLNPVNPQEQLIIIQNSSSKSNRKNPEIQSKNSEISQSKNSNPEEKLISSQDDPSISNKENSKNVSVMTSSEVKVLNNGTTNTNHHIHHPAQQTTSNASGSNNERSVKFLVGIVMVFFVCHGFRLFIQIESVVDPSNVKEEFSQEHYNYCLKRNRLHTPFSVYLLTSFNNLFLVINSSINFVIYCMVGRRFRNTLIELLCRVDLSSQSNTANNAITTAVVKKGSKTFQTGYGGHGRSGVGNQNNDQHHQINSANIATKNGTVVL